MSVFQHRDRVWGMETSTHKNIYECSALNILFIPVDLHAYEKEPYSVKWWREYIGYTYIPGILGGFGCHLLMPLSLLIKKNVSKIGSLTKKYITN